LQLNEKLSYPNSIILSLAFFFRITFLIFINCLASYCVCVMCDSVIIFIFSYPLIQVLSKFYAGYNRSQNKDDCGATNANIIYIYFVSHNIFFFVLFLLVILEEKAPLSYHHFYFIFLEILYFVNFFMRIITIIITKLLYVILEL